MLSLQPRNEFSPRRVGLFGGDRGDGRPARRGEGIGQAGQRAAVGRGEGGGIAGGVGVGQGQDRILYPQSSLYVTLRGAGRGVVVVGGADLVGGNIVLEARDG